MKTYTKKITVTKPRLVIEHDEDTQSPRDWSNVGVFVAKERNYISPDGTDNDFYRAMMDASDYENAQEHAEAIKKELETLGQKVLYIVPVSRYEHGNVVYSRGARSGWDVGICGFYIITETSWSINVDSTGTFTKEHANKLIDGELKTYTRWANGEVYRFTLFDEKGNLEDACGGFYELEDIQEHLPEEWKKEDLTDYIK